MATTKMAARLAMIFQPHHPTTASQSLSSSSPRMGIPAPLAAIFYPTLPPLVQTLCSACRLISIVIIAPIVIIAAIDFAEYAVIRTLGLRRRKVRVKTSQGTDMLSLQLSPAQLRRQTTLQSAPLLTPGAYDAETLLRHRARSVSSASSEALEEWTRTNGAFARVAEVRAASASNSRLPSPTGGSTPSSGYPPSSPFRFGGTEGAMGLSESEAEGDSGSEHSGSSSPLMAMTGLPSGGSGGSRHGLKGSQFNFTPMRDHRTTLSSSSSSSSSTQAHARLASAAAAADLEPDIPSTAQLVTSRVL